MIALITISHMKDDSQTNFESAAIHCREHNADLDNIHRTQFLEMSGALLRKNRSEMSTSFNCKSDEFVPDNCRNEVVDGTKRIHFVSKANEVFRGSSRNSDSSFVFMSHAQKLHMSKARLQNLEVVSKLNDGNLSEPSKRKAELLATIKFFERKLEETNDEILKTQINKELLKFRLDRMILKLRQMGLDPTLKPPQGWKASSLARAQSRDLGIAEAELKTNGPGTTNGILKYDSKLSSTSWNKLRELISEYETRLQLVNSLEEHEGYFKQHLMAPGNLLIPSTMNTPGLSHVAHQ